MSPHVESRSPDEAECLKYLGRQLVELMRFLTSLPIENKEEYFHKLELVLDHSCQLAYSVGGAQEVEELLHLARAAVNRMMWGNAGVRNEFGNSEEITVERVRATVKVALSKATEISVRSKSDVKITEVSVISKRLTKCAVRLLPERCRSEYDELLHSELHDLVERGCGWWAQAAHSTRVLVRVPQLRVALRESVSSTRDRTR